MQYIRHLDLKYLNVLSLNGNNISDKGFAILAQMDLSHLDVLSLSNNSLKDLPGISRFTQL
jgi:Leucine-rich repeat (LRR) protein